MMVVDARISKRTCFESFGKVFVETVGFGQDGFGYNLDVEMLRGRIA